MAEEEKDLVPPKVKPGPAPKVNQKDFDEFKESVNQGFSAIMNKLDELKTTPDVSGPPPTPIKDEAGPDEETPISPVWKKLVTDILGEDFSCELALPAAGGTIFRIIVPKEKSNASQMHWTMFKRDVRSRELGNTGEKGVKDWCLKVRVNLLKSGMKLPVYP